MAKIGFIGAGNMAEAIIRSLIDNKIFKNDEIIASDINEEKLLNVKKNLNIDIEKDNKKLIDDSEIILLAVKPQVIDNVLEEIKEKVDDSKLIISIAAGVTIKKIEEKIGERRIIRVMPNTPCLVGEMAAGFAASEKATDKDIELVDVMLNAAGKANLLDEDMLDTVTGLSGSGPAFFAYLVEGFIEAGKEQGLSEEIATELAIQTMKGTAKLLQEKDMTTQKLIEMVSSPNGTTVAGREVLEKSDVKEIIKKTIEKAVKRSKELGK